MLLQLECGSLVRNDFSWNWHSSASFEIVVDEVVLPLVSGNDDVL